MPSCERNGPENFTSAPAQTITHDSYHGRSLLLNKQWIWIFAILLLSQLIQVTGCRVSVGQGGFGEQNEGIEFNNNQQESRPSRNVERDNSQNESESVQDD
jgi:hypothetical protein